MCGRRLTLLGLALLGVWLQGCGLGGGERVAVDLVAELPYAEVASEIAVVDLGEESAISRLGEGWSYPERRPDGVSFVWSSGPESRLRFFLAEARLVRLQLSCFPFRFEGALRQVVRVLANDAPVAEVPLRAGLHTYEVEVAADVLKAGWNSLCFRYAYHRRVCDVAESADQRSLGVGWDAVGFPDLATASEAPAGAHGSLVIPAGTEVAFFLETATDAELTLEGVTSPEGGGLQVALSSDDGPESVVVDRDAARCPRRVRLPDQPTPVRLAFRALGGAVTLSGPRLTSYPGSRASAVTPRPTPGSERRPNVLVYLVDTLRADRLGCYGTGVGVSPCLDELAADAVLFERTVAQCSWTRPSVASVLTGLGPLAHGVNTDADRLPAAAHTLAETLQSAGYHTAAFTANAHVTAGTGFAQGFDVFAFAYLDAEQTTRRAVRWLEARDSEAPFLLFVHTVDPHEPYEPSPRYRERFARGIGAEVGTTEHLNDLAHHRAEATDTTVEQLLRLYDAEIAQNDAAFGELLSALRSLGCFDDTLVVFVSDHGQAFAEHGVFGHGWDLFGEVLTVPLVVRPPGWHGGAMRVNEPVQHVDLVPTVLEAVGLPVPERVEAYSVLRQLERGAHRERRAMFSYMDNKDRRGISVVRWPYKLVEPLSASFLRRRVLYDLEVDPEERQDLAQDLPVTAGWLASLARRQLATSGHALPSEPVLLEPDAREALVALGYVDG